MDIVFQHNPRRRIPREVIDREMAEKYHTDQVTGADSSNEPKIEEV